MSSSTPTSTTWPLPVVVQYDTVAVVAVAAVLICSPTSTPPPWRHHRPVDGLRYE